MSKGRANNLFDANNHINLFAVLGVHPQTRHDDLKLAYHKLAKQTHPDKVGGGKEEKFNWAHKAWYCLRDSTRKAQYMRRLSTLYKKCKVCNGSGTKVARQSWAHAEVSPCPRCKGCGHSAVPTA